MHNIDTADVATDAASLLQILDEQAALFERWLAFEAQKTEAITRRRLAAMESIVDAEAQLLRELDRLEGERLNAVRQWAGPGVSLPTLVELATALDGPDQVGCLQRHARLSELVERVQERHRLNANLIRQAGTLNAVILQALAGAEGQIDTYSPPSVRSEKPAQPAVPARKAAMIDRRA